MILFKSSHHGSKTPLISLIILLAFFLNFIQCQNQNLFQNNNNNANTNDDEDQYDMVSENDNESSGNGQDDNNNNNGNSYEEELVKNEPPKNGIKQVNKQVEKTPELEKKSQESQAKPPVAPVQQAKPQSASKAEITQKDYEGSEYENDQEQTNDYDGDYEADKETSKNDDLDQDSEQESVIVNNDPQVHSSTVSSPSDNKHITYQSSGSKLLSVIIKPGIMAGIVGGAIIGVLTAILLIMFIVYRMRKKDEGSYALEETKKPLNAYDYRNCPTREFYA